LDSERVLAHGILQDTVISSGYVASSSAEIPKLGDRIYLIQCMNGI